MEIQKRILELPNGLIFRFLDRTTHYYGGFFHVKVEVRCELPIRPEYFASAEQHDEAVAALGQTVMYTKLLERMGVAEPDIPAVSEQLMEQFIESSHAYLSSPTFPIGVVRTEMEKTKNKGRTLPARCAS